VPLNLKCIEEVGEIPILVPTTFMSAVLITGPIFYAAVEEIACAVNATATIVKTLENTSADSSANATTSRATDTTELCAQAMACAVVGNACVMKDGMDQHASAMIRLKTAKRPMAKSVQVMASATAVNANAKSNTLESTARSAQHAQETAMSSRAAWSVKCTGKES
jgi:hypothetical protein